MKRANGKAPVVFAYRDLEITEEPLIHSFRGKPEIAEFFRSARLGRDHKKRILLARRLGAIKGWRRVVPLFSQALGDFYTKEQGKQDLQERKLLNPPQTLHEYLKKHGIEIELPR